MAFLGTWLRRLVGAALLLGFLELLLPEGELHRFARVVMGLLVLLMLLQPLVGLLHLDFSPERILADPVARPANSPRQAERVTSAGLATLEKMRRDAWERSVSDYCASAAGIHPRSVRATTGPDGQPRILVLLDAPAASGRLRELLMTHFQLPAAAIEVSGGE